MHYSNNSETTSISRTSEQSYRTQSTAPTAYSELSGPAGHETWSRSGEQYGDMSSSPPRYEGRESVETYASTDDEVEEEEDEVNDLPEYDVPPFSSDVFPTDAIPATPRDFSDLFPSTRTLSIRHDDATLDGNMNLRIDTQVELPHGGNVNMTLYHLRMHDLRSRDFSLRRYCRESGREVCHSLRKYQKPSTARPALQRSFSSALAALRSKPDSRPSTAGGLKRSDSGYESLKQLEAAEPKIKSAAQAKARSMLPTNTVSLEFSTYARVEVKRRGSKAHKRYAFEYWGVNYTWKRAVVRGENEEHVVYHLYCENDNQPLAQIVPARLSPVQAREEAARGGWIPPCKFQLCDQRIVSAMPDVSDVIVSSGLIALVDDCIKRRFHSKQTTQLHIPLSRNSSFNINFGYVGPKRLINEVFNRPNRLEASPKQQHQHHHSHDHHADSSAHA